MDGLVKDLRHDLTEPVEDVLDMGQLKDIVGRAAYAIKFHGRQGATEAEWLWSQADCVVEEAGEFIGEWRRLKGFARRAGNREDMLSELSDVVIAALMLFWNLGEDAEQHIRAKLLKIVTRGFVNKDT